mmetsp:Transcript_19596/g.44827  ORF Transcript_19596/g.44827 Transcript_19596/m.44827 type:complete len:259 (-) Transcript_19596:859-1635(-)
MLPVLVEDTEKGASLSLQTSPLGQHDREGRLLRHQISHLHRRDLQLHRHRNPAGTALLARPPHHAPADVRDHCCGDDPFPGHRLPRQLLHVAEADLHGARVHSDGEGRIPSPVSFKVVELGAILCIAEVAELLLGYSQVNARNRQRGGPVGVLSPTPQKLAEHVVARPARVLLLQRLHAQLLFADLFYSSSQRHDSEERKRLLESAHLFNSCLLQTLEQEAVEVIAVSLSLTNDRKDILFLITCFPLLQIIYDARTGI